MNVPKRRIVVVGASAAGLRCAARLARLEPGWRITVVEQREVFSYAACGLPYVLAGDIGDAQALRRTGDGTLRDAAYFSSVKGVDVLAGWRAEGIDTAGRGLRIKSGTEERRLEWDDLVLATGARPRRLPNQPQHPRVSSFHEIQDLAPLHQGLARGDIRRVVIVGAGLTGCELAEAFGALWGAEVSLIEAADRPLPFLLDRETASIVARALSDHGVRLATGVPVERIEADSGGARVTAGGQVFAGDMVVVAVGVEPVVDLGREAGVRLGPTGAFSVGDRLATSQPHVWAVGDCTEVRHAVTGEPVYLPLGSLANRQGRCLANILAGRDDRFPPVAGATAVKVFDCNVAAVGLTRRSAAERWDDVRSVAVSAQDRPHYWPETKDIALHLVYRSGSRRVIGMQVVGEGDVTKRVDVASQLIQQGATLERFAHLEHAYAPPYAPALDPLAVAAFAAMNAEDGVLGRSPEEDLGEARILDVRHREERESRPLGGERVTAVPLADLRRHLGELGEGPWLVLCERGTRSAEAVRILAASGIRAEYLGGGMRWRILAGKAGTTVER